MSEAIRGKQSQAQELGLFLVVVASPLVLTPFSASPFVDSKLWAVLAGSVALALSRRTIDRDIAIAAGIFVGTICVTTLRGLDPTWSLIGTEWRGVGLLGLSACALLICVGTGVDESTRHRLPHWIARTGVVVSVIAVVGRFVDLSAPPWRLGDLGGTIGHRVFVGGFVAAAIVSSSAMPRRPRTYAALLVLGSGLAVTAARSAWIAVIVGLIIVLIRGRNWKVAVGVLAPVAISLTAWTVADHYLPESRLEFSAASRFTELTVGSSRERPAAFKAFSRAWLDNPVLGTGAGTGWYAYLTHVRVDEMRIGGRRFGDAHNIVLETAVTHGGIGVLALLALGGLTLVKTKSAPADRAWALGVAAAVGIVQLVEPLSLVLTPLMFLTAGLAMRDPPDRKKIALSRWVAIPLTVALLISTIDLTASSLERYGAQYGSEKAFRWSIRLGPWRLLTPLLLANLRAFDYRQGERSAAIETDTLVRNAVKRHAWNPNVRLNGANVEILLDDFMAARDLYNDQLSIFPLDPDALAGAAQIAIHNGDFGGAAKLARESLELDPSQKRARSALEAAKRGQRDGNYKKP